MMTKFIPVWKAITHPTGGVQFWLAQVMMLVATVVGVHLASSQGFTKAVAFDTLRSDQSVLNMANATLEELRDNVATMTHLAEQIEKSEAPPQSVYPQLQTLFWNAALGSPQLFDLPNDVLSGLQRYYAHVSLYLDKTRANNYPSQTFARVVREQNAKVAEVIKRMEAFVRQKREKIHTV